MHMLRCLFFIEAQNQFIIRVTHLAGAKNDKADDLSRGKTQSFLAKNINGNPSPTVIATSLYFTVAAAPKPGLDITDLDEAVQFYCDQGIADSTRKTYKSALQRFTDFCDLYSIMTPFPVSESILCYYASYLAAQKLSPQTIKTYLAGIRHTQITLGLPEPKEYSSLPRLKLIQGGIKRVHSQSTPLR